MKMSGADRARRTGPVDSARECASAEAPHPSSRGIHDSQRGSWISGGGPDRDSSTHRAVSEKLAKGGVVMLGIDHLMINANRYEASVKFYSWLMPQIGYPEKHEHGGDDPGTGFYGPGGGLWLSNSAINLRSDFNKR